MERRSNINHIKSVSQLVRELGLPAPLHPLIALVDYDNVSVEMVAKGQKISLDFYKISFKPTFKGHTKYGQGYYDFEEGGLAFLKPKQVVFSPDDIESYEGFALYFHPDFIRNYPLGNNINQYGFFSYAVSEALFLSAKEKEIISNLFASIANELDNNIDYFSQDVLVSQIDLLLNYSNRFYNRQFITRKAVNNDIITLLDYRLQTYFDKGNSLKKGLPSVHHISKELNLSQRYLSDMLQSLTGLNTQQYIHNIIIERAKEKLSTTNLSVSEIAYELGFEHPQSFSKLFKNKTTFSPLAFRKSFN
ncbi:helix-turn-helix transcriptional regulator [Elizabethkingia anophelis]|uniref:helix-turn-helix domain-containing protein n=1 Tax=Elizabethkingia anophelis TaxID=1117645 RepID=UPI00201120CA|nr:AraC family transcriptional regulator [Elizabethkingia anophelis]MCL1650589.1 helix-turn-helix transcriptional regulator [Elizabethkingia anophelis]MCL1682601.1 helix-turn-helix transcriptional regulator [Elizabethkingia anophelis]